MDLILDLLELWILLLIHFSDNLEHHHTIMGVNRDYRMVINKYDVEITNQTIREKSPTTLSKIIVGMTTLI